MYADRALNKMFVVVVFKKKKKKKKLIFFLFLNEILSWDIQEALIISIHIFFFFLWRNKIKEYLSGYHPYLKLYTVFTLSIPTPQLLTMLVLNFEQVQFTTRCCV